MFKILLINGLIIGGIYALIALGYSLIYRASGLMTFAQGDMITLGAYLGLTFFRIMHLPFFISFLLTFICAFLVGVLLERGVIRALLDKNVIPIYIVLATIAVHAGSVRYHNFKIPAGIRGKYAYHIRHNCSDRGLCLLTHFPRTYVDVTFIYDQDYIRHSNARCCHGSYGGRILRH